MDVFKLSRDWFDFCFNNPEKIKPNHSALFFFCIEHCNRLGWKDKFGLPTTMAKEAIGISSYNTYINTLNDLVEWGFIILIEKSKNQHSSNIVALSKNDKALDKALDRALIKHASKHRESTHQSTSSINIQETINNKQILTISEDIVKPKKNPFEFIDSLIDQFKKSYLNKNGFEYDVITIGKERKHIAKILQEFKKRNPTSNTENTVKELRRYFDMCNNINDNWLRQNMSLSIIVSKFNEINNILRNGNKRTTGKQPATTDEELAGIFAKHFATDYPKE